MTKKTLSFEDTMNELEEIVRKLDTGKTDLDTSLKLYEQGVGLIRSAKEYLEQAEQKVRILRVNSDGELTESDFDLASARTGNSEEAL